MPLHAHTETEDEQKAIIISSSEMHASYTWAQTSSDSDPRM